MPPCPTGRTPRRGRRSDRAQALVEFSLVATVFLILVLGIINFGVAYGRGLAVETAANNAARFAAVNSYYHNAAAYAPRSNCGASPYTACASTTIQGIVQSTSSYVLVDNVNSVSGGGSTCGTAGSSFKSYICVMYEKVGSSASPAVCAAYDPSVGGFSYVAGYSAYSGSASSTSCGGPGDLVDVRVTVTTNFVAPVLTDLFANGITQTGEIVTVIGQ